uniref:MADF domain-containing protein n=1 Tax=Anopheles christyi TaxID=43041 RepID=A0A182K7V7_9DIPT
MVFPKQKEPLKEDARALELIAIIESQPLLWDKTHPDYRRKAKVENAWQQVSAKIGCTVKNCRSRWYLLRIQYCSNRRNVLKSSQNGKAPSFQPTWYAYNAMSFLQKTVDEFRRSTPLPADVEDFPMNDNADNYQNISQTILESTITPSIRCEAYRADDSERQILAPFIELLAQRLLRKERTQLEEIENEILNLNTNVYEECDSATEISNGLDSSTLKQKTSMDEYSHLFSSEKTLELIAVVERHPLLWDKTHLEYKNAKVTENAWRLVATTMKLDVELCKEKWTVLRAQFRKARRRIVLSSQQETGTNDIYQPSWYAYEAMSFLNEAAEYETKTADANNTHFANTKEKDLLDECAHSFSRENSLTLVSIIESLPVLWDRSMRDTKYAKKADDAWQLVAARVGSEQLYRPSWYAYEAMQFLKRTLDNERAINDASTTNGDELSVENSCFRSNENTLEFIAIVESHPFIWNKAHPDYRNVAKLENAWQLVADEMDLDVEDCKDKWNSLRAQFRRVRRKWLQSTKNEIGCDWMYKPSWYAYDAMTFLIDVIQHGKAKKKKLSSYLYANPRKVLKGDDGYFLDSLKILNEAEDSSEEDEQLSSIDGLSYQGHLSDEAEYLEEHEQQIGEGQQLGVENCVERVSSIANSSHQPQLFNEEEEYLEENEDLLSNQDHLSDKEEYLEEQEQQLGVENCVERVSNIVGSSNQAQLFQEEEEYLEDTEDILVKSESILP